MHKSFPDDLEAIALSFFEGLACPRSLTVAILLRYGEYDQLALLQTDPKQYNSAHTYWEANAATSFLRKCDDLPTTIDRKAVALEGFFSCERDCYRTNVRLSQYLDAGQLSADSPDVTEQIICSARKKIERTLGRLPDFDNLEGRFGPGATFGDRGQWTTIPDKMSSLPTLTPGSFMFAFQWSQTWWAKACLDSGRELSYVRGNRFTTVPKDCTKFRGIAVEPSINLFYQLALGRIVRRRLLTAGIDLQFGQSTHARVAREASIRGDFATIDLSSASDTISYNLVRLLLPDDWFQMFDQLRSPYTYVEGKWVKLEKFSSMGNGYTFELETLVFLALCSAAVEADGTRAVPGWNVHTFGDDIIVPTDRAEDVIAVLRYFGMTTNGRKTFVSGSFRESCGGDFFNGVPVRAFYLKEFPREPQHFIAMANGLRLMASASACYDYRFSLLRRSWFRILDALPSHIRRLRGPQGLGDIVIHDDQDFWSTRARHCIRYIQVYRPARYRRVGWDHFRPDVVLASALYGTGDGAVGPYGSRSGPLGITPRDAVLGYKVGWVPYS